MNFDNDIIHTVQDAIEQKRYKFTYHSIERLKERNILFEEVREFLLSGEAFLERKKCSFDQKNASWKYALKGTTIEGNSIRVILSIAILQHKEVIIITVINLGN